jgi:hypothetical protein
MEEKMKSEVGKGFPQAPRTGSSQIYSGKASPLRGNMLPRRGDESWVGRRLLYPNRYSIVELGGVCLGFFNLPEDVCAVSSRAFAAIPEAKLSGFETLQLWTDEGDSSPPMNVMLVAIWKGGEQHVLFRWYGDKERTAPSVSKNKVGVALAVLGFVLAFAGILARIASSDLKLTLALVGEMALAIICIGLIATILRRR